MFTKVNAAALQVIQGRLEHKLSRVRLSCTKRCWAGPGNQQPGSLSREGGLTSMEACDKAAAKFSTCSTRLSCSVCFEFTHPIGSPFGKHEDPEGELTKCNPTLEDLKGLSLS